MLQEVIELIGVSWVVAVATGISMGWYLAALNRYVPVLSVKKSLITNFVAAVSFIVPIAIERAYSAHPNLRPEQWFVMWFLLITFMMTADIANYVICRFVKRRAN